MPESHASARRPSGELEASVLAALWAADGRPLTPADVQRDLVAALGADLARTTVTTILARLHEKGAVSRTRAGRGYAYLPAQDPPGLAARRMRTELDKSARGAARDGAGPLRLRARPGGRGAAAQPAGQGGGRRREPGRRGPRDCRAAAGRWRARDARRVGAAAAAAAGRARPRAGSPTTSPPRGPRLAARRAPPWCSPRAAPPRSACSPGRARCGCRRSPRWATWCCRWWATRSPCLPRARPPRCWRPSPRPCCARYGGGSGSPPGPGAPAATGTAGGDLTVLDDAGPDAYALPGRPGAIVVTTGMLRALDPAEREVLLAHERAHLAGRHHLFLPPSRWPAPATPPCGCCARPLVVRAGALGRRVRRGGGRRPPGGRPRDRPRRPGRPPPAPRPLAALSATAGPVPRRVAALLHPPRAPPRPPHRRRRPRRAASPSPPRPPWRRRTTCTARSRWPRASGGRPDPFRRRPTARRVPRDCGPAQ